MGQIIHESGKRLERLIENFLIYSQIELMGRIRNGRLPCAKNNTDSREKLWKPGPVSGGAAGRLGSGAGFEGQAGGDIGGISHKIVDELIHNAFKFSKDGTTIQVALFPTESV